MTDIRSLIKKLTLEEKASLCTGASPWSTAQIDRLGVPAVTVADGSHGLRRSPDLRSIVSISLPATCFPTGSCLASSWDRDLLHAMGQALAEEAIAQGVDVILGPGVNMKRSPLCGRNFEYFSEDPYLAGEMAAGLIGGIQEKGVGATLKHFAANNQEFKRFTTSAEIDERTLREIYLTAFEIAIKKSRPWAVMCAYNRVNGAPCSENFELLTDILKDEWEYDGLVMSDWGAVRNRVKSLAAGLDLEMPGHRPLHEQAVVHAVRTWMLDEAALDRSVARVLALAFKAAATPKGGEFDARSHHALAGRIACEGMVLLKNDGVLPLKYHQRIAVIGLSARQPHIQGGGSSYVSPTKVSVPLDELRQQNMATEFAYADGYSFDGEFRQGLIDEAVEKARFAEAAILFIALPPRMESEGYDRPDIDLSRQQVTLIRSVAEVQPGTVVVLNNGAPVAMGEWIDDVAAVLEAWMMGQAGGRAVTDILFGHVNPSGKLAETFPVKLSDTPAYLNWPGENNITRYGEGLFVGYRYYDAKGMPVQFPFGHGLSYTAFSYRNARTTVKQFKDTDGVTVSVDVANTGNMAGKEVVQVYVHDKRSSLARPPKELKGFAKVELQPGESKTVSIPLDFRSFAYYHPGYRRWITEDGDFELLIGASSADIRQRLTVSLRSSLKLHAALDRNSTVREWLDDPRGRIVFEPIFRLMSERMSAAPESGGSTGNSIGVDTMDSLMDMPLFMLLNYMEEFLPMLPEKMMGRLLARINR